MRTRLYWLLAFANICFLWPTLAEACTCSGQPQAFQHAGGDGKPLSWSFETFLISPAGQYHSAVYCYRKAVHNKSGVEVRNIHWAAAGYYRQFVNAGSEDPTCATLSGEMNASPRLGRLFFGISSRGYDTTVREPNGGWKTSRVDTLPRLLKLAQASTHQSDSSGANAWQLLRSEFVFSTREGPATRIIVTSSVEVDRDLLKLVYGIENRGARDVRVSLEPVGLNSWIPPEQSVRLALTLPKNLEDIYVGTATLRVGGGETGFRDFESAGVYMSRSMKGRGPGAGYDKIF